MTELAAKPTLNIQMTPNPPCYTNVFPSMEFVSFVGTAVWDRCPLIYS